MDFTIKMNLDNDAFGDEPLKQTALILHGLASRFEDGEFQVDGPLLAKGWPLHDLNGNVVGKATITQ